MSELNSDAPSEPEWNNSSPWHSVGSLGQRCGSQLALLVLLLTVVLARRCEQR
jgi:hypothetical protein